MMSTSTLPNDRPETTADAATAPRRRPPLRVLVIPREAPSPIFYHEPTLKEEDDGAPESDAPITTVDGLRTRMRRVAKGVGQAEHHAPTWLQAPIIWLKSKLPADERLLIGLRTARAINLIHPNALSGDEARAAWAAYLDDRFRYRTAWLIFYLVALVPSVALTLLPGPNVLGLWVTYRLIAHGLALYGIARVRRGKAQIRTRASAALDGPLATDRREADRVQEYFRMHGLKGRLKRERVFARLRKRQRRAAAAAAAGGGAPP